MTINRTVNFTMACAGMLLFGITLITLGAVLPDLHQRFSLNDVEAGALFAILPFGILAGSLFFGYFCDRYGYKSLLVTCFLMIASGLTAIAMLQDLSLLKPAIFLFGFGGGCVNGATNALVADISEKHKGANLSILGVFFAIGALGIPLVLGLLKGSVEFDTILLGTAFLSLLVLIAALFVKFPPGKKAEGIEWGHISAMLKSPLLILVAFFLFFQSSMEAIIHNWITTYLIDDLAVSEKSALYALTANVVGMAAMRLLIGTAMRNVTDKQILWLSVILMLGGSLLLLFTASFEPALAALVILGAGMAAGFPLMFGIVGGRFEEMSATAFSFVLTVALAGNMLINYAMGYISKFYGIDKLTLVILAEAIALAILCKFILDSAFAKSKKIPSIKTII